jgi:CRP-like cAMP-binding protein
MGKSTNYEGPSHQRLQVQEQLKGYLPQVAIEELLKHHRRLDYPKDAPIFLQGAPTDVTFYVLSGLVKVYCPRGNGNRVLLQLAAPGDISGVHRFARIRGTSFTGL